MAPYSVRRPPSATCSVTARPLPRLCAVVNVYGYCIWIRRKAALSCWPMGRKQKNERPAFEDSTTGRRRGHAIAGMFARRTPGNRTWRAFTTCSAALDHADKRRRPREHPARTPSSMFRALRCPASPFGALRRCLASATRRPGSRYGAPACYGARAWPWPPRGPP